MQKTIEIKTSVETEANSSLKKVKRNLPYCTSKSHIIFCLFYWHAPMHEYELQNRILVIKTVFSIDIHILNADLVL